MTPDPETSRYRVYRLEAGELAEVARTSRDGIGLCLVTLHDEGQIIDSDAVGILDRLHDGERGTWIVNPFGKGT